jgi:hypothetical protein
MAKAIIKQRNTPAFQMAVWALFLLSLLPPPRRPKLILSLQELAMALHSHHLPRSPLLTGCAVLVANWMNELRLNFLKLC